MLSEVSQKRDKHRDLSYIWDLEKHSEGETSQPNWWAGLQNYVHLEKRRTPETLALGVVLKQYMHRTSTDCIGSHSIEDQLLKSPYLKDLLPNELKITIWEIGKRVWYAAQESQYKLALVHHCTSSGLKG